MVGDGRALPFPDACFDKVIAAEVLEHVPDDAAVLAELARVLRPGGTMAVTVPRWYPEVSQLGSLGRVPQRPRRPRPHLPPRPVARPAAAGRPGPRPRATMPMPCTARTGGCAAPSAWTGRTTGVVRAYHRLLVWDITAKNPLTRWPEALSEPGARQEPCHLRPQAIGPGGSDHEHACRRPRSTRRRPGSRRSQLPDGMVPWYRGGHADPWNHVEATMALAAAGRWAEVERGFDWLAAQQLPDGSWCTFYVADGVTEPRRDPNVCAYPATGAWWCSQLGGGPALLETVWPMIERAVNWCLGYQRPGGEIVWSVGPDGVPGNFALLAANSSLQLRQLTAFPEPMTAPPTAALSF